MSISAIQGEFAVAMQYAKYEDGHVTPQYARGYAIFTGNPADADTITIGLRTYRFKNTMAAIGDVKIGVTKEATLANLNDALIAKQSTSGTAYYAATLANMLVDGEVGSNYLFLTAFLPGKNGNTVAFSKSSTAITLSNSSGYLIGGVNGGKLGAAKGRYTLSATPSDSDDVVINAVTYTFKTSPSLAHELALGASRWEAIANLLADAVADTSCTFSVTGAMLNITFGTSGTAGNAIVLTESGTASTVTGSGTLLGGTDVSVFDRTSLAWVRIPVIETDYDAAQMQEIAPPEIKRVVTPNGAYKTGVAVGGTASMLPRLQTSLGDLLFAALGAVATTNNGDGSYTHVFTFDSNDQAAQPWIACRKMIPGNSNPYAEARGLIGFDNKISSLSLAVAAARPVSATAVFEGRVPEQDLHPEAWAGSAFEDFNKVALACKGTFSLPTIPDFPVPMPTTGVSVELGNATTGPREEMIVGSYFMEDIITRLRSMSIRFVYKWKDPYLMDYLFGSAKRAINWDPTVFETITSGGNKAFDLLVDAPIVIGSSTRNYSLEIVSNHTTWQVGSPVRLRGGDIIMLDVRGTVLTPSAGDYCQFILTNDVASYGLPAEP